MVLFRHFPGGTETNHEETVISIVSLRDEIKTRILPHFLKILAANCDFKQR
jgi:hypothetical protein